MNYACEFVRARVWDESINDFRYVVCKVEVDFYAIAERLAKRSLKAKCGKATSMHRAIVVKAQRGVIK
jgi:hypothetical protein